MMYNGYYSPYNGAMNDVLSQYKGQYQQPMMPMQSQQMPIMRNQPQSMQNQQTQPTDDRIWVNGEVGAKAFFVVPNSTVTLWDSENPVVYIKSSDPNGVPSIRIFDAIERNSDPSKMKNNTTVLMESFDPKEYVRLEQFEELRAKYAELEGVIKKISKKKEAE